MRTWFYDGETPLPRLGTTTVRNAGQIPRVNRNAIPELLCSQCSEEPDMHGDEAEAGFRMEWVLASPNCLRIPLRCRLPHPTHVCTLSDHSVTLRNFDNWGYSR